MLNYSELTHINLEPVVQMLLAFPSALKLISREWTAAKNAGSLRVDFLKMLKDGTFRLWGAHQVAFLYLAGVEKSLCHTSFGAGTMG